MRPGAGNADEDEADEDARRFGIAPPTDWAPPPPEVDGIWEEHLPALIAFLQVSGQWRCTPLGQTRTRWLGLDYAAVRDGLDLAGISVTPVVWEELRLIEAGAVSELNKDV